MDTMTILIVDDEKDFAETLAQRLNQRGVRAEWSSSGNEALKRIDLEQEIGVVVLDLSMPYPDGIQTLNAIKKKHPLKEVILLTGHSTVDSAVAALKLGAFDYLMKPCELDDLLNTIQEAVKRKKKKEEALFNVRIKPYISDAEREKLIDLIMNEKG